MKVTLHSSGGLRTLIPDLPSEITMKVGRPATIKEILMKAGINPLLVVLITVDGKRVEKDHMINEDAEIGLVGPMAGG